MGETLLMGHCLHRRLLEGAFAQGAGRDALHEEAQKFKAAFDVAYKGSDRGSSGSSWPPSSARSRHFPKLARTPSEPCSAGGRPKAMSQERSLRLTSRPSRRRSRSFRGHEKAEVKQFLAEFENTLRSSPRTAEDRRMSAFQNPALARPASEDGHTKTMAIDRAKWALSEHLPVLQGRKNLWRSAFAKASAGFTSFACQKTCLYCEHFVEGRRFRCKTQ